MKTSNIIFSSIIGSITLIILSGAIEWRFFGDKNPNRFEISPDNIEAFKQNIDLPEFQYLVINDMPLSTNIILGGKNEIELILKNKSEASVLDYHIKGDTLFIEGVNENGSVLLSVNLFMTHGQLNGINSNQSGVNINQYNNDSLTLVLNHTTIDIHQPCVIGSLSIFGTDQSTVNVYSAQVDTLKLDLNNSTVRMQTIINKLQGQMSNHSELDLRDVSDLDFKKDNSSRLNYWN